MPEQVKAQIDALDRSGQFSLFALVLADPRSHLGELSREMGAYLECRLTGMERAAGFAPEEIDPDQLLCPRFGEGGAVLPPEKMVAQAYRLGLDMATPEARKKSINQIRSRRARVRQKKDTYRRLQDAAGG
jgi:hypothetical protein